MAKNDKKISELLKTIETKRASLGDKPRASWLSNGLVNGTNINIVNNMDKLIELTSALITMENALKDTYKFLEIEPTSEMTTLAYQLTDLKLKAKILKWESEKRKLELLEVKLKNLRSEDAKTSDAISDIMKEIL